MPSNRSRTPIARLPRSLEVGSRYGNGMRRSPQAAKGSDPLVVGRLVDRPDRDGGRRDRSARWIDDLYRKALLGNCRGCEAARQRSHEADSSGYRAKSLHLGPPLGTASPQLRPKLPSLGEAIASNRIIQGSRRNGSLSKSSTSGTRSVDLPRVLLTGSQGLDFPGCSCTVPWFYAPALPATVHRGSTEARCTGVR